MTHKELKAFFSQKPNIIYPFHAIEKCKEMEIGKTIGITCKINNLNVPAIIIKCDENSVNKFGINYPPPRPGVQFRMLDLDQKDFVIEIVLHFDNGTKMRLHLDPSNNLTRQFLSFNLRGHERIFHFHTEQI